MMRAPAIPVLVTALACVFWTKDSQLPEELASIAEQLNCGPVPDFFARPGMVEPPYLYGYLPGPKESSAAFWCYRGEDRSYLLVTMREGRIGTHFPWRSFPGGLSLSEMGHWELSSFRYVDEPGRTGPSGVVTDYRPIRNEYDGVVTLFYEHEGRWLYRIFD